MSIETQEIKRVFRYNGITLLDVPGLDPRGVRDLYSAQYPELVSAEIEDGGIQDGEHVFTFRKAVGTKGAGEKMAAWLACANAEAQGKPGNGNNALSRALGQDATQRCARALDACCRETMRPESNESRMIPSGEMLAPVA